MVEQAQSTESRSPKSKMALLTEVCGGGEASFVFFSKLFYQSYLCADFFSRMSKK